MVFRRAVRPLALAAALLRLHHVALAFIALITTAVAAHAQRWPVTDGVVHSVAVRDGRVYLGGAFHTVGTPVRHGVVLSPPDAAVQVDFDVNGDVRAIVADGAGGWYVGGGFTTFQGAPRAHLAHVGADGRVTDWNPGTDYGVLALHMEGGTVYAGGFFTMVAGQPRSKLAAIDAATGQLLPWNPGANAEIDAFAVSGGTLYLGGAFTNVGGVPRNRIAALDRATGAVLPWDPNANGTVVDLEVHGAHIFAAGSFTGIGDALRRGVAELELSSGYATGWNAQLPAGSVSTIASDATTLYLGGNFHQVGVEARPGLAAVSIANAQVTPWNPAPHHANGTLYVSEISLSGSVVYIGGNFTHVGGLRRKGLAAIDAGTGVPTAWIADASDAANCCDPTISTVVASPQGIAAGGLFRLIGKGRDYLASIDIATRALTGWDPLANGNVLEVLPAPEGIWVGGAFSMIGGQSRKLIARLDPNTGAASAWSAALGSGWIGTLRLHEGALYAGGSFGTTAEPIRYRAAAFDATTGETRLWNPDPNQAVFDLVFDGDAAYAGGFFTTIGGRPREHLALLGDATGAATQGWNPGTDGHVEKLSLQGGTLRMVGSFGIVAGVTRSNAAAVDAATGTLLPWNPNASHTIRTLLEDGGTVYLGGDFSGMGGANRNALAAVDASTGAVLPWNPVGATPMYESTRVYDVAVGQPWLFVGGYFEGTKFYGEERDYFAAVSTVQTAGVAPSPASTRMLLAPMPHPLRSGGRLRFTLQRSGLVSLGVYDVAGRQVARLVADETLAAGLHERTLPSRLHPGVYLVRLEAAGATETGRIVVIDS